MNLEIGSRFKADHGRGYYRVFELVASLPEGQTERWPSGERHTVRCVEEKGFVGVHACGVGSEMHVEDAWFLYRKRVA